MAAALHGRARASPPRSCGSRRAGAARRSASCWPAARRWSPSAWRGRCCSALTPAADRPWVSGTSDNSICQPDLRLQRPRPHRRPGRRAAGARRRGRAGAAAAPAAAGGVFGGATGPSAPARREPRRPGRLAARLRARRRHRASSSRAGCAAPTPRTGWLIAVGGAFATTAVAFSYAKGIFHPYYVSLLAPFTAALVGAGAGAAALRRPRRAHPRAARGRGGRRDDARRPRATPPARPTGCSRSCSPVGVLAAVALALRIAAPRRAASRSPRSLGALALAPATWAVQTLGHATSGTFPAGGPTAQGFGGPGGGSGGGGPALRGGGGPPAGAAAAAPAGSRPRRRHDPAAARAVAPAAAARSAATAPR